MFFKFYLFTINTLILMNNIELLTESVTGNQIIDFMRKRNVAAITYNGDGYNGYTRYVEFYSYGTTLSGKLCVIGFQRNNYSSSLSGMVDGVRGKKIVRPNDRIMWRIFLLSNITSLKETKTTFDTSMSFVKANRPKINLAYKNLSQVYYKIIPEDKKLPPTNEPVDNNENNK